MPKNPPNSPKKVVSKKATTATKSQKKTTIIKTKEVAVAISKQKVSGVFRSLNNHIKTYTHPASLNIIEQKPPYSSSVIQNIIEQNPPYERWYCGITKHANGERLKQHIKNKKIDGLYYKQMNAGTMIQANAVERRFSELGTSNAPESRGATSESIYVYVFKITANTVEKIIAILTS